jgi:hypothetical protein
MVKINELGIGEDVAGLSDIAAMAAVAGLAAPVMGAMVKAAFKTGKGINAIRKIAKRAGVALSDKVMGEDASGQSIHPEVHTEAEQPMAQAPQPQEETMPIDANAILNFVNDMESKKQFTPEYADQIRNAISSLGAARKTLSPHVLLQLMTMLTQGR